MDQPSIYVSYAWKAEEERGVLECLEKAFKENGIHLTRDKHMQYRDSISNFMESLAQADCIIVVVSEPYLKSEYCMNELLQIYRNGEFRKRVFPVLLEGVRIDRPMDRLSFVEFWEDKYNELERRTKKFVRNISKMSRTT